MGSITINGKNVKQWVIGGKTVKSLTMGGKVLSFTAPGPWHFGGDNPHPTKNDWIGYFDSQIASVHFREITNSIPARFIRDQTHIKGVSLPNATRVEAWAFYGNSATIIKIPKVTVIQDSGLSGITNSKQVDVWINKKFDTPTEKDRIFGKGSYFFNGWDQITFHWTNDDGTPWKDPNANYFIGTFSTPEKQTEFEGITTTIALRQFINEPNITSVSLPNVVDIGAAGMYLSPLTYINIPKATTIGYNAFHTVVNAASTEVTMNKIFDTDSNKNKIFGTGHWNNITFHWTDDNGNILIPNSFVGTWSTPEIQAKFMAVTNELHSLGIENYFSDQPNILGVVLPYVTTIGTYAMLNSPLTLIKVPKATTIGYHAFLSVVNAASTEVTMNKKFNTNAEKDRIFGDGLYSKGGWNQITFHWLNDDGSVFDPNANSFVGTWSTPEKQAEFKALTTTVAERQFTMDCKNITEITIPLVTNIGLFAFYSAPLTRLNIPKATSIASNSFYHIVNAPTTEVWMNHRFDTTFNKDKVFGAGHWNNITFHWLNDDGSPAK